LVDWLGGRSAEVASGAVVGIPPDGDPDRVIEAVTAATAEGYTRIRLKIGPGFDRVPVAAVRQAFPALHLQADANGAYRLDAPDHPGDARRLADLDEFGLACLEQPLPPADLAAHAALAEHLATPIALDESLTTPRRVSEALRYRACRVACLKPARLGGLAATLRSVEACRAAGIDAFVGGFFETGLGRSANAALASHPGFTLPGDLSSPAGYLVADPFSYPKVVDGRVAVPSGPGVAPAPDSDLLERHTVEVLWTAAPGR
jgi:O-succinylbenzoate synthase